MTPKPPIPTREELDAMTAGELRALRRAAVEAERRKSTPALVMANLLRITEARALAGRETI